jgi:hypothetical protein
LAREAYGHPLASVAGSEIFELGVIPGETDFRIFNAAGIPGYDFALIQNGHVYHTIYDDEKHVSVRALEYGGKILLLPLVMQLAGSGTDAIGKHLATKASSSVPPLDGFLVSPFYERAAHILYSFATRFNSSEALDDASNPRVAFFDLWGTYTVVYTEHEAKLLGWGLTALFIILSAVKGHKGQNRVSSIAACRMHMVCCLWTCVFAGFASATITAVFYLHVMQQPLSWYGSTRFAIAVFGPPVFVGVSVVLPFLLPDVVDDESAALSYDCMLFAVSSFYAALTSVLTILGLMTSFIPMVILAACLVVASGIIPRRFVILHFILIAVASVSVGVITAYDLLGVLLSVMGRSGTAPSEIVASALVTYMVICYWVIPLLPVLALFPRSITCVRSLALSLSIGVACFVWILPELTLPHRNAVYSKDAPKRVAVAHFHSPSQSPPTVLGIVALDSIPVDINTTLRMLSVSDVDAIGYTPVWGLLNSTLSEMTRPYQQYLAGWTVFSIPGDPVDLAVPRAYVVSEVASTDGYSPHLANVTIAITAHDSLQISVRVPLLHQKHGVIRAWSFDTPPLDMGDGGGCWVRHVGRNGGAEQVIFSVIVHINAESGIRPRIVFDVTSMRLGKSRSRTLQQLYFPQWVAPIFTQVTGESFSL